VRLCSNNFPTIGQGFFCADAENIGIYPRSFSAYSLTKSRVGAEINPGGELLQSASANVWTDHADAGGDAGLSAGTRR
jgi:hypothetical protein